MATAADGTNLLLGKGKLYLDRLTALGVSTGERFVGACNSLGISVEVESKQAYSSAEASAPLLQEAIIRQTHIVAIAMSEYTADNLALFLLGTKSTLDETGSSSSDESHASVHQGTYVKLLHRNVKTTSPAAVVKVGITTKTAGTDYVMDCASGRVYIVPGGGIAENATILVTYTWLTESLTKITAGAVGKIEAMIRFVGDPTAGPALELEVWRVSLTPDGELGLISDDYGEFKFKAKILSDATAHPTDPYYRLIEL